MKRNISFSRAVSDMLTRKLFFFFIGMSVKQRGYLFINKRKIFRDGLEVVLVTLLLGMLLIPGFSHITSQSRYVKTFEIRTGISQKFSEKFRNKLSHYFFDQGQKKCRLLSDDDVKIMYQQVEIPLKQGCNAEQSLIQIAYAIDADMVIHDKLEKTETGKNYCFAQSIVRDRKADELNKTSIVELSFFESQIYWGASDITKNLINPKYEIPISCAPNEIKVLFKIVELKSLDIKVFEFKTEDATIAQIIDYSKQLTKESDEYFKNKDYLDSLAKYEEIITKIDTKLPESKQRKLAKFKSSVIDRIVSAYAMNFKSIKFIQTFGSLTYERGGSV